jgi:hypothetical protein
MARELFGSGSGERLHRLQLLRGQAADESLPMPRRRDWLSGEDKPVRRELHLLGPGLGKASAGALLDHGPGRSTSRSPKPPYRPRLAANSVMMSVGSVEGGLDHLFYSLRPRGPRGPRPSALGPRPSALVGSVENFEGAGQSGAVIRVGMENAFPGDAIGRMSGRPDQKGADAPVCEAIRSDESVR